MTKVNALLLEAVLLKTSILIVILATIFNSQHRNTNHQRHNHHHIITNHRHYSHHSHHNNHNNHIDHLDHLDHSDHLDRTDNNNNHNNNNDNHIQQDSRFKFNFGNLFLQADAYRVPYQYPRYPRLRKEYPANAQGAANPTRYAASASALDSSIVANIETNEVVHVDMRIRDNSQAHHTQLYEMIDRVNPLNPTGPALVLRRGDPMTVVIHLRNNYQRNTDKIRLEFSFGPRPQVGKGTLIYLPITNDRDYTRDSTKWDAKVLRADGNVLTIQINIPANIAIGIWRFKISTKLAGSRSIKTYSIKEALYVIFNSWSKDDAVYLSSEDARKEYVLNDVGKIYIGSHSKPRGRKWIYGQFHEAVLPAVMFMLDKTRLDIVGRSNVVKVARAVSAMVNSHDDNGLLVGNWSGNYGDGLAPWQWTGSATILEKYLQTGGEPVKFGQCWVFAGVTTTVLRTLGIPARTVSNFVSAHDTDDSLTVDKFFSEKGDPISDVNSDSIWNFHVWSDAWMARTDLPPGYGGWQAVDATPQETSMGMYQMGPASLEAIRKGEVGFAYDAAFVFAEVNADVVHWQQDDKSDLQWRKIKTNKYHVGRKIFTKRIGMLDDYTATGVADAEDIISQYKNKEGTEEERMSVLNAARCGGLGFLFEQPAPGKEDVEFDLIDIDKVMVGQPFFVIVKVINRSDFRRTITIALSASSVFYTGILAQKVKRDRQSITLNGRQEQVLRIRVGSDDYIDKLVDYSMMKIYAIATVKETQQTWSEEDDFMIEKPQLLVQTHGQLMVNRKFDLEIRFTNPLEQRLTSCGFTVEGPGLAQPLQIAYRDILPLETITHIESFVPRKAGPRTILVALHSAQLIDVIGSKQVQIYNNQPSAGLTNPNPLVGVAPGSGTSGSALGASSDGASSSASLIDNTDNTGSLASEVASVDEGDDSSSSGSATNVDSSSGSSALTDSSSDSVTR